MHAFADPFAKIQFVFKCPTCKTSEKVPHEIIPVKQHCTNCGDTHRILRDASNNVIGYEKVELPKAEEKVAC